jgi:hypothetical protein
MQRLNRKKRQLPLRHAPQAAPASTPAAELYQATVQMLKEGTTSDAYEFANDTLTQLEEIIIPAVMDGYAADQETLTNLMRHFDTAITTFEGHHPKLEEKHSAVEQARSEFETCHSQDAHDCDPAVQCEMERERLWTIYTTKETEYLEVVTTFKHQWCEVSGNRSDPIWRESMSRRFDRFITEGQERITAWEAHESWKLSCLEKNYTLGQHQELCGQKQRALEAASCAQLTIYNNMMENLHTSWAFAIQQYNDIVPRIRELEEMRHAEFKSLKGIKCLLKWIVERALKPCDEEEEPGVLEHMLTECESYWQIDVDLILSPFNLTYPELPSFPVVPELQPYPCTDAYVAEEYGHLTGSCVPTLVCQPCAESPYEYHAPASTDVVSHHNHDATVTEGAPEDLEEFKVDAHSTVNGDVIKIMSPVADSKECAEECNALDGCKAVRYFNNPQPTCELLSHYQVDDHLHATFSFTFMKESHDGTEVQNVVEEVVFEHFDDQPEVEKITFESVDTNGDGFIDTNEYVELSKHLARVFFGDYADMMPVEHWEAIGDRAISDLDTSKDLRVNREELIAGEVLVKEFVKSFQAYGEYLQSQAAGSTANGEASLLQFLGLEQPPTAAPSPMPAREGTV